MIWSDSWPAYGEECRDVFAVDAQDEFSKVHFCSAGTFVVRCGVFGRGFFTRLPSEAFVRYAVPYVQEAKARAGELDARINSLRLD